MNVLDHGIVTLIDHMGDDRSIVRAARVSVGKQAKDEDEAGNRKLIGYLLRNGHTSPLEHVEFEFYVKAPIFVFRQWHRHRTAHLNEMSLRYTEAPDEFYVPDLADIRAQSKSNKQGREAEPMDELSAMAVRDRIAETNRECYRQYQEILARGTAREIARLVLPVTLYSQMYWKIDLHNLLHFLRLRLDAHAQLEIRRYAEAIAQIVASVVPITWGEWNKVHGKGNG